MEPTNEIDEVLQHQHQQLQALGQQLVRVRQIATAAQAESFLRFQNRQPRFPIEFTSQYDEDTTIWTLTSHQTNGFFIEAGAFDGYRYSVTYGLEAIGWTGLLVEAIPERAKQCAVKRPHSRVVNAALGPDGVTGEGKFCLVDDQYGGMLSYSKERDQSIPSLPHKEISVPRTSLNALLADHKGEIDALVLDLEGAELDALQGFDLNRFQPRLLLIEENLEGNPSKLLPYMQQFPQYTHVGRLMVNELFIRADQKQMFDEVRWLLLS